MSYIWNIYEKSFTPYFASLAPKHLVHRHKIEAQPCKLPAYWRDPKTKTFIRGVRRYVLQNAKIYYFCILACKLN